MSVLRDIFRRRFRSMLTIVGISVGVLAVVVIGAFSERSIASVENIDKVLGGKVLVVDENDTGVMGLGGDNPLAPETIEELREMPGVSAVAEGLFIVLDENAPMTGVPAMILGFKGKGVGPEVFGSSAAEGRLPFDDERGVVAVGSDLVGQLGAEVGGTVKVRGRDFRVVGLLERTMVQTDDQSVVVPIADAQEMFYDSLPEAFRSRIRPSEIVLQAYAIAEDGVDAEDLARRIEAEIEGVAAMGPEGLMGQVEQLTTVVKMMVAAVGVVALIVGALSVVTTMLVAVVERTRELGVKRGLGATRRRIARDVLTESALMSLLGGLLGLAGAALMVFVLNAATAEASRATQFAITPRLVVGTMLFALFLGILGGLYPARYAARLDPIDALAHE